MNEISPIIREKAPIILAEIQKAKSVLLHCHPSPDPDSVGSALAMKFALEQMSKTATVIRGDSEIPPSLMHFPGANDIVAKNFFEIDHKEFDLFIILDSAAPHMISRRGTMQFPLAMKTVNIDHHVSNTSYADINLIDASPATSFIVFQLFKEWNIDLSRDIALNLMLGIYSDTGGFKYCGTDYRVFGAASELARYAPDYSKSIFSLENTNAKEAIYFDAFALNAVQTYLGDNLVISVVSNSDLNSKSIPQSLVGGSQITNQIISVVGWNIGVLMTEIEPNKVKISFRTRDSDRFNVSKLAIALGGGGHKSASGALLNMSIADARDLIISKARELYSL